MAALSEYVVDVPQSRIVKHYDSRYNKTYVEYVLEVSHGYDRQNKGDRKGVKKQKRVCIGHLIEGTNSTKMHPTKNYQELFRDEWERITGKTVKPDEIKIGLYCAMQAIDCATGILGMLEKAFGVEEADGLMDYAMYSILEHSDVTSSMEARMENELLFSEHIRSDSWYGKFFQTMEEKDRKEFLKEWISYCKEQGAQKVWICLDGSNIDCSSQEADMNEKGHTKSGKNKNMIAFSYVVSTEGLPITYEVYRGSLVDSKVLPDLIGFLKACGFEVMGVILDRGYCDSQTLSYLLKEKIEYIIMCKGNSSGYRRMVEQHGQQIKFDAEHWVWTSDDLFAIQDQVQVFQNFSHEDYLSLFFNFVNAAGEMQTFLSRLSSEIYELKRAILSDQKVSVSAGLQDYVVLREGPLKKQEISLNLEAFQKKLNEFGLYGVISSLPMNPSAIHLLYQSRSASEVQFRTLKSQLGYDSMHVRLTSSLRSKFFLAFLSCILRYEIENAVRQGIKKPATNEMIEELNRLSAVKINDAYGFTHAVKGKVKKFFQFFGQDSEALLQEAVKIENDRLAGRYRRPKRRKPGPKKGSHHKKYDANGKVVHKKPGPKKGYKRSAVNKDGSPRKKPGVKVGTKRGPINKDGTPRKKPGPKPRNISATTISEV